MFDIVNALFLLLLDARKGNFFLRNPNLIARGLASAVLGDLVLSGRLKVRQDQIVEMPRAVYIHNLLRDTVLHQVSTGGEKTIQEWVSVFASQGKMFVDQVASDLIQQGTIGLEEGSYLGFFPHPVYIPKDRDSVYWIVLNLRAVALYCEPPTPQVVRLIHVCICTR